MGNAIALLVKSLDLDWYALDAHTSRSELLAARMGLHWDCDRKESRRMEEGHHAGESHANEGFALVQQVLGGDVSSRAEADPF